MFYMNIPQRRDLLSHAIAHAQEADSHLSEGRYDAAQATAAVAQAWAAAAHAAATLFADS